MSIITTDLVVLDVDAGGDKEAVIGLLAGRLAAAGRASDRDGLIAAAMAREAQSATGLPGGIAIPHCRSPYVDQPTIGFARLSPKVDFGAPDGPADLLRGRPPHTVRRGGLTRGSCPGGTAGGPLPRARGGGEFKEARLLGRGG